MDYLEDAASFWTLRKAVKRYITYAELGIWQKHKPNQPHPTILFVYESNKLKKKVESIATKELDSSYVELNVEVVKEDDLTNLLT